MSDNPSELTHFNAAGDAHMVDVGDKAVTHRVAVAGGKILMLPATYERRRDGGADWSAGGIGNHL